MAKHALPVCILEGTWWSNHEVPLILPYFHAWPRVIAKLT